MKGGHWLLALGIAALVAPTLAAGETDARNRLNWMLQCQGCHRIDGTGTGDEVPPIADNVARFLHVPGGREFLVRVPGVTSASLGDAELASLVNWMLREFDPAHLPADFAPYDAAEIRAARSRPFGPEVAGVRARLVAEMEARGN